MTDNRIFITVVIPTHNRKDILKKCLEAFPGQSYPKDSYEIVVIDDGSTDGTKELLAEASKKTANLRYFSQAQGGPAKARNLGIEKAKGTIILLTGDDCIPGVQLLEEHNKSHQKDGNIAVLGHIDWHPDLEVTPFMHFLTINTQFSFPTIKKFALSVPYGYFYTSNISLSKELLQTVGGFDEDFALAVIEDVEIGYRLSKIGTRIVYNPKALTYHYHPVDLEDYRQRNYRLGRAAALLYKKHPELQNDPAFPIKNVNNPEVAFEYYDAVLKYATICGLQDGLEENAGKKRTYANLLPLKYRLRVWYNDNLLRLAARLREQRSASGQLREYAQELEKKVRHQGTLVEELQRKNMEKQYRIVELEKFECRAKSSIIFKLYERLGKLMKKEG